MHYRRPIVLIALSLLVSSFLPASTPADVLSALNHLKQDDSGWNRLGSLITGMSFQQAAEMMDIPDVLNVLKRDHLVILNIFSGNQTQNYVAVQEGPATSWIAVPQGFRRLTDAAQVESGRTIVLTGYYHMDTYQSFAAVYAKRGATWKPAPEAFADLPEELAGQPAVVDPVLEGEGALPALVLGDVESKMVPLALGPGPTLKIGDEQDTARLVWERGKFRVK